MSADSLQLLGHLEDEVRLDASRHESLATLSVRFSSVEDDALVQRVCPGGSYPVFRLDGIKASKHHLKDVLVHDRFNAALRRAVETTYYLFRNQAPKEAGNFFMCATSFSDEVSFVLGSGGNYYENRLMKLATVLAGTLSAAMTAAFHPRSKTDKIEVAAFDARPLVLSSLKDIDDYHEYRWLVSYRNALSKALRLAGSVSTESLYSTDLKTDLLRLARLVDEYSLRKQVETILSTYTFYFPGADRHLCKTLVRNENDFRRFESG